MLVDVVLYKTKLSTTDTMVFDGDTAEEVRANQSAFFATLEKKTFTEKLSFNGRRSLRIKGNYWLLNLDGYNYCTITYSNKTYFCFIDKFTYVNDNCTQFDVTTDYIQTYLTEIKFSPLYIEQRNYSLKDESLLKLPYKNTYPVGSYELDSYQELNSKMFISVIIDGSAQNPAGGGDTAGEALGGNYLKTPTDINSEEDIYTTKLVSVVFPITIQSNGTFTVDKTAKDGNQTINIVDFSSFIKEFNSVIMNIAIMDALPLFDEDGRINNEAYLVVHNVYNNGEIITYSGIKDTTENDYDNYISIDITNKNLSLMRSPYCNIYIYRRGGAQTLVNMFNCILTEVGIYKSYTIHIIQDIIPDCDVLIDYSDKYRFNTAKIKALSSSLPFSVDSWDNYKLSKSATSSDALATKHSYDMEIADRNYQNARNIAKTNLIKGATSAAASVAGGGALAASGSAGGAGGVFGGIGGIISAGFQYQQDLENATTAYENEKTNIEKESALLQLEYQDIKNAPDITKNFYESNGLSTSWYGRIRADVYIPSNIGEIIKYHKKFGFETSLQTDITTINGMHDINAQYFDYINTMNANVISENIPKQSADIIAKIFDSGIYLWRNYEKLGEDYFSNYAGE